MNAVDNACAEAGVKVIKSTYESQHDILRAIRSLHCPEGFHADLTYGNGGFWKELEPPPLRFDLTPQVDGVVVADSRHLPLTDGVLRNAVFDPPFLTYVRNGRDHKNGAVSLTARFGGYWTYDELTEHYISTMKECWRVLQPGGRMVFKCQDIIHNHRMHCTHSLVINEALQCGFRLVDLFVLVAKHRMPSPQVGKQRHARIHHSYFLVLEKLAQKGGRRD